MIISSINDNDFLTFIEISTTFKTFIAKKYDQFQQIICYLQNQLTNQQLQIDIIIQEFFSTKPLKFYFIKIIDKESTKYINDNY